VERIVSYVLFISKNKRPPVQAVEATKADRFGVRVSSTLAPSNMEWRTVGYARSSPATYSSTNLTPSTDRKAPLSEQVC